MKRSPDERRLYHDLAWTWPIVSPPERYVREAQEIRRLIRGRAPDARTLLHLGCGGGHLDMTLKRSFEITGVDLSPKMLALARRLNPKVPYRVGDMRSIRLRRTFDAVVIADSVAYMRTERELRAAFGTAFVHLAPGGVFLTYVERTPATFRQNATTRTIARRGDVEVVMIENQHDPDPTDTTYESTFIYLIRRRGRLRVETDRHRLGFFPLPVWLRLLRMTGFRVTQVVGEPDRQGARGNATFVCVRPARKRNP
jgi:SAM-dependent methyltransferase